MSARSMASEVVHPRYVRFTAAVATCVLALLIVASGAQGAAGDLTPQGCIADTGDFAGCGTTQQGLSGAKGVAVSPDGKSVCVASQFDAAIGCCERQSISESICELEATDRAPSAKDLGLDHLRNRRSLVRIQSGALSKGGGYGSTVRSPAEPAKPVQFGESRRSCAQAEQDYRSNKPTGISAT